MPWSKCCCFFTIRIPVHPFLPMSQNVAKNEHDKIGLIKDQENRECKHVPAFLTCIESYWINLKHIKMIQTRPSPALTCKAWNIELGTNSAVAQVLKARTSAHQSHNQPTGHHHLASCPAWTGNDRDKNCRVSGWDETWWNMVKPCETFGFAEFGGE